MHGHSALEHAGHRRSWSPCHPSARPPDNRHATTVREPGQAGSGRWNMTRARLLAAGRCRRTGSPPHQVVLVAAVGGALVRVAKVLGAWRGTPGTTGASSILPDPVPRRRRRPWRRRTGIAANARWSRPMARADQAAAARAAILSRLERQVDPAGLLTPEERAAFLRSAARRLGAELNAARARKRRPVT
jgi:hypothetical protein